MNASHEINRLVDDLAARWTDAALEALRAAGAGPVTVETELKVWGALKATLRSVLCRPRSPGEGVRGADRSPHLVLSGVGNVLGTHLAPTMG